MVNAERPTINAWRLTRGIGSGEFVNFERNPYYWKIDTSGNQLPYLDDISVAAAQNQEVILAKAINGEIDNQYWHLTFVENKPVLSQNPDIRFYDAIDPAPNSVALALNFNNRDPEKRKIFEDKNFRIALSIAIDREAINDLVFLGRAEISQGAPIPSSRWDEEMALQYTEFDPDKARRCSTRPATSAMPRASSSRATAPARSLHHHLQPQAGACRCGPTGDGVLECHRREDLLPVDRPDPLQPASCRQRLRRSRLGGQWRRQCRHPDQPGLLRAAQQPVEPCSALCPVAAVGRQAGRGTHGRHAHRVRSLRRDPDHLGPGEAGRADGADPGDQQEELLGHGRRPPPPASASPRTTSATLRRSCST